VIGKAPVAGSAACGSRDEAQEVVTRLFWPDELPSGTALERNVAAVARDYERNGSASIAARLAGDEAYRESCAVWPA
jgi:hypothetical protein